MSYYLNPNFNFIFDSQKKLGYITDRSGRCHIINDDAHQLLQGLEKNYFEYKENDFIKLAIQQKWLVEAKTAPKLFRYVPSPFHLKRVQFEMLLQCNLECAHCYCSSSPNAPKGLSTDKIFDLIDQMAAMGVLYFDITGGEPLLRPDCFDIIDYAQKKGLVVSLFTNATLLDDDKANALKQLQIASVQTSLDAFTPDLHDEFRGRKGAFKKAIQGIRLLKKYKIPASITIVVNKSNQHEIKSLVEFIKTDLQMPYRLDRIIPSGRALLSQDISLSNAEFYKLIKQNFPNENSLVTKVCDSASAVLNKEHIEPSCGVGASYAFIKSDGEVCLCPTMTKSESSEFETDNLKNKTLKEIWETNSTFVKLRGMQCANSKICPASQACKGGCRSNAYLLHGKIDSPDEFYCNLHKNSSDSYVPYIEIYASQKFQSLQIL